MKKQLLTFLILLSSSAQASSFLITGALWTGHIGYEYYRSKQKNNLYEKHNFRWKHIIGSGIFLASSSYFLSMQTKEKNLNLISNTDNTQNHQDSRTSETSHIPNPPKNLTVQKDGKNITIQPKEEISLDQLISPHNQELFFEICLEAAKQMKKYAPQATVHFKTSESRVQCIIHKCSELEDPKTHDPTCTFCRIPYNHSLIRVKTNGFVSENNCAIAFLSNTYNYPKCLIIPKKPIVRMSSLTPEDKEAIIGMTQIIQAILNAHPEYKNFELEMHNGSSAGQTVHHLHWHFKVPSNKTHSINAFRLNSH